TDAGGRKVIFGKGTKLTINSGSA
uniref:Uncharacterized protein n=1 Tax=Sinocyclocheilus grahami TaxID=75366 RepID=A0A672N5K5_SINGR